MREKDKMKRYKIIAIALDDIDSDAITVMSIETKDIDEYIDSWRKYASQIYDENEMKWRN